MTIKLIRIYGGEPSLTSIHGIGIRLLDAGIKASFLGADLGHSYAAWEERPEVKEWFAQVFLKRRLCHCHEITICFEHFQGFAERRLAH